MKGEAVCLRGECHCTNPLARGDGRLICDSYRKYIVIGIKAFKQAFRLRERGFKIAKRRRGKMKGEWGEWGEILRRLSPLLIPRVSLAWFARRFFAFSPTTTCSQAILVFSLSLQFCCQLNFLFVFSFFLSNPFLFLGRGGGNWGLARAVSNKNVLQFWSEYQKVTLKMYTGRNVIKTWINITWMRQSTIVCVPNAKINSKQEKNSILHLNLSYGCWRKTKIALPQNKTSAKIYFHSWIRLLFFCCQFYQGLSFLICNNL